MPKKKVDIVIGEKERSPVEVYFVPTEGGGVIITGLQIVQGPSAYTLREVTVKLSLDIVDKISGK